MKTVSWWPSSSKPAPRRVLVVVAMLAAGLFARPVEAACSINATSVAFGAYDVFTSAPVDSIGTVSFRCTANERNIVITLSTGGNGSYKRAMQSGAGQLAYNLYRDASRTSVWGDGSGGTAVYQLARPPRNEWVTVTVYGRIPPGQDSAIGSYADGLIVTIDY